MGCGVLGVIFTKEAFITLHIEQFQVGVELFFDLGNPTNIEFVTGVCIVEKLRPGNESFTLRPGDHVFDQAGLQGYCLLDAYTVAEILADISYDDGASLVYNVVASFWVIFGAYDLALPFPSLNDAATQLFDYSKHSIVIIGAGSNWGKYAL
ncbi:MAG: hypothetical protein Q9201_001973 [Fulgogasparrea decipioides]